MEFVVPLDKVNRTDADIAGGKGANLGEMIRSGMPVPPGFVVLSGSYTDFLGKNGLDIKIAALIEKIDYRDPVSVNKASAAIAHLILAASVPSKLEAPIFTEFKKLKAGYVAVRSSATAEDSCAASWAGELETFLNTDKNNLIENIKKCWASLFSPRALAYAFEKKLVGDGKGTAGEYPIAVAVVVQKMIDSEISGICFTANSVSKDKNHMVIEAGWGLGEAIVSGQITPDNYIFSENEDLILEINVNPQRKMIVRGKNGIKNENVPKIKIGTQKLSGRQIVDLARICQKIESDYGSPQDIEWAFLKNKFYIVQSRPITVL